MIFSIPVTSLRKGNKNLDKNLKQIQTNSVLSADNKIKIKIKEFNYDSFIIH